MQLGKQETFEIDRAEIDPKMVHQYHHVNEPHETIVVEEDETVVFVYDVVVKIVVEV